jgi:UDP-N-acetylglucosamine 4-epimerase
MFNEDLYKEPYHKVDLCDFKFLVTGGAGFIGSNIVEYLLKYNAGHVRVLDNLSNGYYSNIEKFIKMSNFEFIEGDIRDLKTCQHAVEGIDYISHQAALGSVPRSIKDPIISNEVNISGFLNILFAAKNSQILKRFVYAASSSTYGDSKALPKIEGNEGKPLSPYAVTKVVNELYAEVFSNIYKFHTVGLRYFNIFGPNQSPNNPYAAVIPIFCKQAIDAKPITIFGDGDTSRDFTFVENAIQANILAMLSDNISKHEVINIACGDQVSLNEIVGLLEEISGNKNIDITYSAERPGDVKHSKADITKARDLINYKPLYNFKTGLKLVYDWYYNSETRIFN